MMKFDGRGALRRLLDHAGDLEGLAEFLADRDDAVLVRLVRRHLLDRDDVAAMLVVGGDHLLHRAAAQHVGQDDREGLVADQFAGAPHRMTEARAAPAGG